MNLSTLHIKNEFVFKIMQMKFARDKSGNKMTGRW
jgi:hypothetical protein